LLRLRRGIPLAHCDDARGYRGHNYPNRFKVWISGQVRRVTKAIRREMRRRAAIEPVIGHLKEDHRILSSRGSVTKAQ
jgi:transposase, IS5 family